MEVTRGQRGGNEGSRWKQQGGSVGAISGSHQATLQAVMGHGMFFLHTPLSSRVWRRLVEGSWSSWSQPSASQPSARRARDQRPGVPDRRGEDLKSSINAVLKSQVGDVLTTTYALHKRNLGVQS